MHSMISVPIYDTHGAEGCVYIINHGKICEEQKKNWTKGTITAF